MKHTNHIRIQSYHVNRFGEVSMPNLFWYMQEIAWEHANILGFGFEHLREDKLFWVLSRLLVRIDRLPSWKEEIMLETWSRGTNGFYAFRDYKFIDKQGVEIIKATSSWLVLDIETRRIHRLNQYRSFPGSVERVFDHDAGKVEAPQLTSEPTYFPVKFDEIDINQHFNTGRYLERINNSYSFDFHEENRLKELEVNFIREGMPNDLLAVIREDISPENHLCSVVREKDNSELIRARLLWQKKM